MKLSKHEFVFVTYLKRDKVVTIYNKFWFVFHLGKRLGKENAHSPLKNSRFSTPLWHFQTDRRCILLLSYCYNTKDMFCLKISNEYFKWNKSYGGVKNGMLYSENVKIINMRLTISVTDMSSTELFWH